MVCSRTILAIPIRPEPHESYRIVHHFISRGRLHISLTVDELMHLRLLAI